MSDVGDFFVTVKPDTRPVLPVPRAPITAPQPTATTTRGRPTRSTNPRLYVGLGVLVLAGLVALVFKLAGSGGQVKDNLSLDRTLGHGVGMMLPAPITRDQCTTVMQLRFKGITSAAGRSAFLDACVNAHGPSDPALTSDG